MNTHMLSNPMHTMTSSTLPNAYANISTAESCGENLNIGITVPANTLRSSRGNGVPVKGTLLCLFSITYDEFFLYHCTAPHCLSLHLVTSHLFSPISFTSLSLGDPLHFYLFSSLPFFSFLFSSFYLPSSHYITSLIFSFLLLP